MNKFKFIYAGQQHRNLRENFGEIAGDENSAFRSNLIDEFAAQEYYPDPIKTRAIYVAVDPTGGGKSALSFFAVTNDAGMWVVSLNYTFFLFIELNIFCVYYDKSLFILNLETTSFIFSVSLNNHAFEHVSVYLFTIMSMVILFGGTQNILKSCV